MKFKLRGSTNLLKIVLSLGISISLWNCNNDDYDKLTTNEHTNHEEYKNPFQKISYSELVSDYDFGHNIKLIEKHSDDLIINKQALKSLNKNNDYKKVKLSILKTQVIKIEKNNTMTWTFELERNLFKKSDFENFVVRKSNGTFTYFLISYSDTKHNSTQGKGSSFSFEIAEENLDLEDIPLQSRGNALDWAPTDDGGGGIDTSDPCEGIWIPEYKKCDSQGNADGHGPAIQLDGSYCSGSELLGYIIDFSHCTGGTYNTPNGPSHDSTDPGNPTGSTGGGGNTSDIANSSGNDNDNNSETLVSTPIDPDENNRCPDGFIKNPSTGKCESICKGGKIYDPVTKKCNCPDGKKEDSNGNCVDDCDTTKKDLKKIFPDATDSNLEKIANHINTYGREFGIDNKEKLRHFLAQAGHESKRMKAFEENLNYQWKKLAKDYWRKYFNLHTDGDKDPNKEDPNDYKRSSTSLYVNVEKFANHVYDDANRDEAYKLGNTSAGDGYKYRGRGIIQLTGKSNYKEFNTFYQEEYDSTKDLVNNPDILKTDMKIAVISALWFFKNKVIDELKIDGTTTVTMVTNKVNGGYNGLEDRKELYNKAKTNIDCK
ncbi:glycoside hydrolase family 19 protein [Tenacibaculum sp. 190524A05c]|uniref:glycoside hydrolase family 19 protein n=1 Tax=Tenacibaculum platacis TaxID=3137852 RepID=UPI0032B2849F